MTARGESAVSDVQETIDAFYWKNGPCCAGCDWWREIRAGRIGLCTRAAPVAGFQRTELLGITGSTLQIGAGHPFTQRGHHCGDFKDDFNWEYAGQSARVQMVVRLVARR